MDLHFIPGAVPTPDERNAIDAALSQHAPAAPAPGTRHPAPGTEHPAPAPSTQHPAPGTRAGTATRSLLLPALHAAAARAGWISEGALNYIGQQLGVPPADAYGVASFYGLFSTTPRPSIVARVCDDIACRARGAEEICRTLEARLGRANAPTLDGAATWLRSPCLGQCDRSPAALYHVAGRRPRAWSMTNATADSIADALERAAHGTGPAENVERTMTYADTPRLLARVGIADPESLDSYLAHGGGAALRRALQIGRDGVIQELLASKLAGRGGAAFPTGRKWEAVARAAATPHFVVCNADESEPGTFKDRVLMEDDPFAIVEAMTIAGFTVGARQGYIYIRGEYPLAAARMEHALTQARTAGLLGSRILQSDFAFDVELRRGAGAYICGEETALFNSIEGYRGEPRNKPPFPVQAGLFGKPTLVNNVETLAAVLDVVVRGGAQFASIGTSESTGTRLFCLSGSVVHPGVYEVTPGTTLRALIQKAGGVAAGRQLRAVLLGGAAGTFMTPDELDLPLSFEGARHAGATLGSGVVMVFDDTVDLRDITLRIAAFFREESCGQCVPCRVGTVRQEEALGQPTVDLQLVDDVAQAMRDASICGLGQTAASAVQSAIRKLRIFEARAAVRTIDGVVR